MAGCFLGDQCYNHSTALKYPACFSRGTLVLCRFPIPSAVKVSCVRIPKQHQHLCLGSRLTPYSVRWLEPSGTGCSPTSSTLCSFGYLSMRRTWKCVSREEPPTWWKGLKGERGGEGRLRSALTTVCIFLKGGSGTRGADLSLATRDKIWGKGMKGRSDIGKSCSLRQWSVTGSPGNWSWHQACKSSRSAWTTLLVIWVF